VIARRNQGRNRKKKWSECSNELNKMKRKRKKERETSCVAVEIEITDLLGIVEEECGNEADHVWLREDGEGVYT
jgi:hypothetical protein